MVLPQRMVTGWVASWRQRSCGVACLSRAEQSRAVSARLCLPAAKPTHCRAAWRRAGTNTNICCPGPFSLPIAVRR